MYVCVCMSAAEGNCDYIERNLADLGAINTSTYIPHLEFAHQIQISARLQDMHTYINTCYMIQLWNMVMRKCMKCVNIE